ncbi:hypothetical protein I5H01_gp019 [Mycobacterium phage MarkPhew]|uniref:AAA-ATPase n=1 Tax=Mycobacterium phage MarkPhew TaxID=2725625 RepID=A0A6M3SZ03_9CAUD|nr:hypothetical protein I5H01_gp019 [Mycobacterium phage MarkPhew]QJD50388.1 hypothetical protein SEA_MARKPHEW_88 [Mycobacterium phage MarkPhew]
MPAEILLRSDRQAGKTTALLDVALANARRGARVLFWSPNPRESQCAVSRARDLIVGDPEVSRVSLVNGRNAIEYASGGRVMFTWHRPEQFDRADVEVFDGPRDLGTIVRRSAEVRYAGR